MRGEVLRAEVVAAEVSASLCDEDARVTEDLPARSGHDEAGPARPEMPSKP